MIDPYPQNQPLPPNAFHLTQAPFHDAYEQCLMMETAAGADMATLMLARCLGYLIRELPVEAKGAVANEVVACNADFEKMKALSKLYIDCLIRPFRQSKGRTPVPSEHHSRSSIETRSAFFSEAAVPAPTDHQTAKKSALIRDNYRCVVTDSVDVLSFRCMGPADLQRYSLDQNPLESYTHYCHILPPSTNSSFNPDDPAQNKNFRFIDVHSDFDSAKIHHLENGLTMAEPLHLMFENLSLWFEEVANNTYRVCALNPRFFYLSFLPPNRTITLTSTDPHLPLPNPEYLRLHAAVCRVAHLSGAAGYLDLEDREVERLGVLAHDGSSADLLASRLQRVALMT